MATSGEPLAAQHDDPGLYPGEHAGQLNEIDPAILAALHGGLIMPGDPEQVQGIHIPESYILQGFFDLFRHLLRIPHLGKGRQNDVVFPGNLYIVGQFFFVDAQIDHALLPRYAFYFAGPSDLGHCLG